MVWRWCRAEAARGGHRNRSRTMPPLNNAHHLERRARTIVESLQGTWRRGKGMCCCPAHDDRTPSLSVTLGRKAILFHCFAGCPNEDVIAALDRQGVRSRDLFNGADARSIERQSHGDFSPNARRLWQSATAISDSPAAQYLAKCGLLLASEQHWHHRSTQDFSRHRKQQVGRL